MIALITDPNKIAIKKEFEIDVKAGDSRSLLIVWLNKIINLLETEDFLFKDLIFVKINA